MKFKSIISYTFLSGGVVFLYVIYQYNLISPERDILLTLSGFCLGVFGAYLYSLIEELTSFSKIWRETIQSILAKDITVLRECLSKFITRKNEYLPEISLNYATHFRILKFLDLTLRACEEIANGEWARAEALLNDAGAPRDRIDVASRL